jgi:hypothetical protein
LSEEFFIIAQNRRPDNKELKTARHYRSGFILLGHVPAQARWSNRARNRAHAQKLDGALRKVEKLTRLASTPGYLAFCYFLPRPGHRRRLGTSNTQARPSPSN